jgi:hypothetical protein
MVMVSPCLALVTPSPGIVSDLVTPILKAVLEKSRVEVIVEGVEKVLMLREKSRELCRSDILVLFTFRSWVAISP